MRADDEATRRGAEIRSAKEAASNALREGRLAEGRALAARILSAQPSDPEALFLMAQADMLGGHSSLARAQLARATALVPQLELFRAQRQQLEEDEAQRFANPFVAQYLGLRARHMDYPLNIQLETVGRCNANCTFCPHEELDRKFDEMSDELFDKIVGEAATTPVEIPVNFYLNVVNEPFMDKKIFERMRKINQAIPRATIGIYTNLNVLPRNFFDEIRLVRQSTSFNISFNAANAEEYTQSMRIDFDRTVANIRQLLSENRKHRMLKAPLCLSRIATLDERDDRFAEECAALFPQFAVGVDYQAIVRRRANWLGRIDGAQTEIPSWFPCLQWLNISIHCDGTVPHCCMDAKGEFAFGNVKERSLLEIYNSPPFRTLREAAFERAAIHPCRTCALV
jgi:sulfatase maturation enzyme AslB (radical SAM superfamily)